MIAVLLLATLVAVPCLAEEETKVEAPKPDADVPETAQKDAMEDKPEETEDEKTPEEKPEESEDQAIPEELKGEVTAYEKRGVPHLSSYSCRILKKHGYCNNKGIARFCTRFCCHDGLSHASCISVKHKYKKCNHHVGRLYCRKTCGHCPGPLPAHCIKYKTINDITRRQSIVNRVKVKCDKTLVPGWYRMIGKQGTYIPNKCVGKNRCGTHAPGWVVGIYPPKYKTIRRKVCYHWNKNCCHWHNFIKITNCGGFYVFYLNKPPVCSLRYCGNK